MGATPPEGEGNPAEGGGISRVYFIRIIYLITQFTYDLPYKTLISEYLLSITINSVGNGRMMNALRNKRRLYIS